MDAQATQANKTVVDELEGLADLTASEASAFLTTVTEVAAGASPDMAIPMLLLALSQVQLAGTRLAAIGDVVPPDQFEADPGPDDDADPLHDSLANLLTGIDEHIFVIDPLTTGERGDSTISGDIADVALALSHGLKHYGAGRKAEALWWWQFSFLSSWGDQALLAQRALVSIVSHLRLDADADEVSEAEFDALHP